MSYIKFNDSDEKIYGSIMPFKTQHGISAIRIGTKQELSVNENGFKVYSDKDEVLEDFSEYKYFYEEDAYSKEKDVPEYGKGTSDPIPTSFNSLSGITKEINRINEQMNQNTSEIEKITPYVETKMAYVDDEEIVFEVERSGRALVDAIDSDGNSVECLVNREGNRIIVTFFEPLQLVTKVTISIQ